ncbi:GLPGLI family protein [Aureicoccus marinus]|uniref:GLPGLI family protein n=1 Tax=Aureicoccus marinus TaxID=754435 RepID=A0A2S7T842_9FLAO|nr:GLPGLI family protein [Aureicoccus marinus]PQJ15738.1 hypothetical protein BST99_08360 [Aureicoccus marinus]
MTSILHLFRAKGLVTVFTLVFLTYFSVNAQDFQGKAVYMSKTKIEMDLDGRNIPAAQKEMIMKRMKEFSEKTFDLDFDRTGSVYQEQAKLETPGAAAGGGFRMAFAGSYGIYYKNVQEKAFKNQTELFGKIFLVSDSLNQWEWKMGTETKKIGNYTCYKATAIRKRDTTMMQRFRRMARRGQRGRRGQEGETAKDSIQKDSTENNSLLSRIEKEPTEDVITAWFTPEIPVSQGPGPYWGLPGLILEVSDGRTALLCTKITLNPEEKKPIAAPKKGKVVSQEEYNKIMADKMEEMSERFRGGNRRGGGNTIRIRG